MVLNVPLSSNTEQKMKFFITDYFRSLQPNLQKLRIWSDLLKNSITENFIFCAVELKSSENLQVQYHLCSYFW